MRRRELYPLPRAHPEAPWTAAARSPAAPATPAGLRPRPPALYSPVMTRRLRLRPPGLKPSTRIGTLGPYRGRLGLGWVVAPIVVGAALVIVAIFLFLR